MTRAVSILDTIADIDVFAPWFKDRVTWHSWFVFLAALYALPMTANPARASIAAALAAPRYRLSRRMRPG